ncbi:MAG TPA: response regulator transcription factor [bacterium]|nr:response regulator transcription factor [bacterium]HQL63548.1 response regulator transcription factor [bacterium]
MVTKVILADDHRILREGLRALLEKDPDIKVIAEADNGRRAVELVETLHPHVVIMDIGMADMNGIEATRRISELSREVKVIGLSIHSDKRFVFEMLRAGAAGFLLKECAFEELHLAIEAVLNNQVYLSPKVTGPVVEDFLRNYGKEETHSPAVLTRREKEVLQLLAEGKTSKEAAKSLRVSPSTIDTHRSNIMKKLGMNTVADLIKYAVREGLTPGEK